MAFLIDKYLPEYTYNEYHQKLIHASAKKSFLATKDLDMRKSFISKFLFKLRRLPTHDLYLQGFLRNMCFVYKEEEPFKEFVIEASQPGLKMYWNFYFKEIGEI